MNLTTKQQIVKAAESGRMTANVRGKLWMIYKRPAHLSFSRDRDFDVVGPNGSEYRLNIGLGSSVITASGAGAKSNTE